MRFFFLSVYVKNYCLVKHVDVGIISKIQVFCFNGFSANARFHVVFLFSFYNVCFLRFSRIATIPTQLEWRMTFPNGYGAMDMDFCYN